VTAKEAFLDKLSAAAALKSSSIQEIPMVAKLSQLLMLSAFLAGCTAGVDVNRESLAKCPKLYSGFDVTLDWEVQRTETATVIARLVKNCRYVGMDGIEVWVTLLDGSGQAGARGVGYVIPHLVRQGEIVPFALLPPALAPGTPVRFTYRYQGNEGGGVNWMQSFRETLPAG
jgi:hypothetical protein